MKLVIQRVIESNLTIDKKIYSKIGYGIVIFIGISANDNESFLNKIANNLNTTFGRWESMYQGLRINCSSHPRFKAIESEI